MSQSANPYIALLDAQPKYPVTICVVQAENANGTTSCLTLDGHPVTLQGTAGRLAGQEVAVQGGRIIGDSAMMETTFFEV